MKNRVTNRLNPSGEGYPSQHKIILFDQIVSAFTNYIMIFIPMALGEWQSLGQLVLFQSLYALFIGISRAAFGTTQIVRSDLFQGNKFLGLGILLGLVSGAIASRFSTSLGIEGHILILIFLFPIIQDVLRFERISKKNPGKALASDVIWLFFSMVFFTFSKDSSLNLTTSLVISWAAGASPASLYLLNKRFPKTFLSSVKSGERISAIYLLRIGATALISEMNTITVNWLLILTNSATILGEFRFFQISFLPIAFLINLNRIILTPYFRDGDNRSILIWLKKQYKLRLCFYMLGFLVIIVLRDSDFQTIFITFLTLIAIELAFKRNLIFQRFMATGEEVFALKNIVLYYLTSVIFFLVFSRFGAVLYLSVALVLVELFAYIVANSRLFRKHV